MSEPVQHQDHMRAMTLKDKKIAELETKLEYEQGKRQEAHVKACQLQAVVDEQGWQIADMIESYKVDGYVSIEEVSDES